MECQGEWISRNSKENTKIRKKRKEMVIFMNKNVVIGIIVVLVVAVLGVGVIFY